MIKPWITPYAGERHKGPFAFDGQRISFPGQQEERAFGVLWQPAPENDDGEIWWKEMHTGRQRRAMVEGLCQVCGTALGKAPLSWLIPDLEVKLSRPSGRPFTTATPPTCQACVLPAQQLCPNLHRKPPLRLSVQYYRPHSVFGDLVGRDGKLVHADLPLGHADLPRMMARHLIVEVLDYRRLRS